MITQERYKELMASVGMPNSTSLMLALQQCAMEAALDDRKSRDDRWIKLTGEPTDELPDIDEPVWMQFNGGNGKPVIFIGCISDTGEGWLWCRIYEVPGFNQKAMRWESFNAEDDDDYKPAAWKRLPKPYTGE